MQSSIPGHRFMFRASLFCRLATCVIAAAVIGTAPAALGQSDLPATDGATSPAVPEPKRPDLRFNVGWVSAMGSYTYVPEKWGELHLNLVNSRDEARELLCVTFFDEQPQLQFGRRVWVPAQSKIQISHPILLPKCEQLRQNAINFHSLIFDSVAADNALIKNETGQLLQDGAILVTQEGRATAVIGKIDMNGFTLPEDALNLIRGGRACQELSEKLTLLGDQFLPADETSLNCFDHLVIADDRIENDLAFLTALRQWLNSGGHLWIMLDRVDVRTLEALLGDDFRGHLVDRVSLTSVRIDQTQAETSAESGNGTTYEFDEPVQMARAVIPDMEVPYTVNGWPAALTKRCGDGYLMVTTLGARGWLKLRDSSSRRPRQERPLPAYVPSMPMDSLATIFFSQRDAELIPMKSVEPQVREYVGYAIPSWGLIVGTLLTFALSLCAAGVLLWRAGRLEHLGWIGSGIAVGVSILLLMIGHSYRHRIGETVASVQMARPIIGTDDVRSDGLIAVYHPEGSDFEIQTSRAGRMMPEMTGVESSTRRMVTTDFGVWHWENLKQPAGLRMNSYTRSETVPDRIEAHATFDANGVTGRYSGRLAPGTDAMVATRVGRLGVDLQSDGSFTAGAADVFKQDQFLNARLVNDEQDRRRRTLQQIFTNPKRRDFPDRPQLMFWSDRWKHGFQFLDHQTSQDSALISVPLIFHRPQNGTEIFIPSPILPYRNRVSPDGTPPSTMWNYHRNEWQERADPGSTWLSFRVPRELLPLSAHRARMDIQVSGPVGLLEVQGLKDGAVVTLKKIVDPVGLVSIEIDDPGVLSIHSDGTLNLGVIAGDPSRPELTRVKSQSTNSGAPATDFNPDAKVNYWRINSLALQLWAKADEPAVGE